MSARVEGIRHVDAARADARHPVADPALPPGWATEVKWDGWRALLSWDAGRVVLRSRKGTDLAPSLPEVCSGTAQLPEGTALDGVM